MTDRELLELAAKALWLNIKAEKLDADDSFLGFIVGAKNTRERVLWNPLTDDGDALRMAVKLRMDIVFGANYVIVDGNVQYPTVNNADDPYLAVRCGIVRTAAEIATQRAGQERRHQEKDK